LPQKIAKNTKVELAHSPKKAFILQCFDFLKKIRPAKNREIFGILNSHNQL